VGLSVFFPTSGSMAAGAGVAVLYDRPGFAMPSLQPPPGVVALPPTKIKVRKAQMERNHPAIDALPPDPALVALVEGLGLKAPGGDKLGGTPEWVDGAALPATARLVLQLDLDSIAWTKKQKKTWPDAALYGELYVFLGEEGPIVVWQNA
jgi:hypothetical protein